MPYNETYAYPFDPTGSLASNLIQNERHSVHPEEWMKNYFIVPNVAPFFRNSLQVILYPSGVTLTEGTDFVLGFRFEEASRATTRPVYGAISFLNRDISGYVEITYQTIGGNWAINEVKAAEMMANTMINPRITLWGEVVQLPYQFPPIDHEWDLVDMTGATELIESINALADIIASSEGSGDGGVGGSHIGNFNNPHNVDKAQVGLGLVPNYGVATNQQMRDGAASNLFATPSGVRAAIEHIAIGALQAHINDDDNPHNVNKAQVGLGNVENFSIATTSVLEQGTSNIHYVTVNGVRQMITAYMDTSDIGQHANRVDNPHNVSKGQVGLSNVDNFATATPQDMLEPISNTLFVTPNGVRTYVESTLADLGLEGDFLELDDFNMFLMTLTDTFDDANNIVAEVVLSEGDTNPEDPD